MGDIPFRPAAEAKERLALPGSLRQRAAAVGCRPRINARKAAYSRGAVLVWGIANSVRLTWGRRKLVLQAAAVPARPSPPAPLPQGVRGAKAPGSEAAH